VSDPTVVSPSADVVGISMWADVVIICVDVVSAGDDVLGIGDDVIRPIGNIMHKQRQA
jgi:hypothetical protein